MIYIQLFLSFMKIGFTSFGGLSMVPLILEEMQAHGWMNSQDLSNLVAIAEMTPGPLGINCATFTGTQTAGLPGSIAAVLGVLTPAFTLTMVIAVFFEKFKESDVMRTVRRARPVRRRHCGADAVPAHEEEVDRAQGDPERRRAGRPVLRRAAVHGDQAVSTGRPRFDRRSGL